jgi:conjugal transfer pilus assembly protein TraW
MALRQAADWHRDTGSVSARLALLVGAALVATSPAFARDYGQQGTLFPVIEVDMLRMIEAKLRAAQASGRIDAANRESARRSIEKVKRPPPVSGITPTVKPRVWLYDPTITIDQDLRDQKGRLIIAKGARVNPLDTVGLRQRLVFLDGDDPAQVAWAMRVTTALNAKLILTRGAPALLFRPEWHAHGQVWHPSCPRRPRAAGPRAPRHRAPDTAQPVPPQGKPMISDIIGLWKIAPPAAPETDALRRLRVRSMVSCMAAALSTAAKTK